MLRHLTVIDDLTAEEVEGILREARRMKALPEGGVPEAPLAGKTLAMIFEKPSTRTRVSFEVGMTQLGGHAVCLRPDEIGVGTREDVRDVARVLSRYADLIMARTFAHRTVVDLAAHATVPVINGLSDWEHPCQALGDLLTVGERFGEVAGRRLAFVGDGNNVARSLAWLCAKMGAAFRLLAPAAYHLPNEDLEAIRQKVPDADIEQAEDPSGVADADVIYTDVWASMGQEAEGERRRRDFRPYQVNAALLARAGPHAVVMHCLPAHRNEEIADEVIDGGQSIVYDQAENRLIWVDCDVIEADGGTRTLAVTGGYVVLVDALRTMEAAGRLPGWPLSDSAAGVSVGVLDDEVLVDLDYSEDRAAEVDMNVVLTGRGRLIEVQGTAEGRPFSATRLGEMVAAARRAGAALARCQQDALERG